MRKILTIIAVCSIIFGMGVAIESQVNAATDLCVGHNDSCPEGTRCKSLDVCDGPAKKLWAGCDFFLCYLNGIWAEMICDCI